MINPIRNINKLAILSFTVSIWLTYVTLSAPHNFSMTQGSLFLNQIRTVLAPLTLAGAIFAFLQTSKTLVISKLLSVIAIILSGFEVYRIFVPTILILLGII